MIDAPISHRWLAFAASGIVVLCGAAMDDRHATSEAAIGERAVNERAMNERATSALPNGPVEALIVTDAWSRPALKGSTGGAYMTLKNMGTVALRVTGASAEVANAVELHESTTHEGMAHMQMKPSLELAPGASTTFKPGGLHFMLIGLRRALVARDTVHIVLRVESTRKSDATKSDTRNVTVLVPVRVP